MEAKMLDTELPMLLDVRDGYLMKTSRSECMKQEMEDMELKRISCLRNVSHPVCQLMCLFNGFGLISALHKSHFTTLVSPLKARRLACCRLRIMLRVLLLLWIHR